MYYLFCNVFFAVTCSSNEKKISLLVIDSQWVFWGSVVRFQKITKIAKRWNCLAFLPTMAGTDDPHWRHHHPVVAAGDTTNEGIDPPDGAPEGKDQLTVHQRTECGTKKNEPNLDAFNAFNAFRRTNKSHCCLDAFQSVENGTFVQRSC